MLLWHPRPVSAHIGVISRTWHWATTNSSVPLKLQVSKTDEWNTTVILIGGSLLSSLNWPSHQLLTFQWLLRLGWALGEPAWPLATEDILIQIRSHRPQLMLWFPSYAVKLKYFWRYRVRRNYNLYFSKEGVNLALMKTDAIPLPIHFSAAMHVGQKHAWGKAMWNLPQTTN